MKFWHIRILKKNSHSSHQFPGIVWKSGSQYSKSRRCHLCVYKKHLLRNSSLHCRRMLGLQSLSIMWLDPAPLDNHFVIAILGSHYVVSSALCLLVINSISCRTDHSGDFFNPPFIYKPGRTHQLETFWCLLLHLISELHLQMSMIEGRMTWCQAKHLRSSLKS